MTNDPAMRVADAPYRTLYELKGNHGYGLALAHGPAYVCLGIRRVDTQGQILVVETAEELDKIIDMLQVARVAAFGIQSKE